MRGLDFAFNAEVRDQRVSRYASLETDQEVGRRVCSSPSNSGCGSLHINIVEVEKSLSAGRQTIE